MTEMRSEPKGGVPLHEDVIEEQMQVMRETRSPCSACQGSDPFDDLNAYQKKIETRIDAEISKN